MLSKIIFITGPSCSGKTSLKEYILANTQSIYNLPLHTTRPQRDGEVDKVDYFFDTEDDLKEYILLDGIFEKTSYFTAHGTWHYYTLKNDIRKYGTNLVCGSIDTLSRYYKEMLDLEIDVKIIPIFLNTDIATMVSRYLERNRRQEDPEITRRALNDFKKYNSDYKNFIDSVIPDDNVFLNVEDTNKNELFKIILNRIKELI